MRTFLSYDQKGSTSFLFDDTGAPTDLYSDSLDGATVTHLGTSWNPYTFLGGFGVRMEERTGLYNIRGKWYDPATSQFIDGALSARLKSGANQFHGFAFELPRNNFFNANEFPDNFNGVPTPRRRWNEFGGSLGGPIVKNKLFFFNNYPAYAPAISKSPTGVKSTSSGKTSSATALNLMHLGPISINEIWPGWDDRSLLQDFFGPSLSPNEQTSSLPQPFVQPGTNAAPPVAVSNETATPSVTLTPAFLEVYLNIQLYGTPNPTPAAVKQLQNLKRPGSKRYRHGYAFINDKGIPEYVCDGCTPQN